MVAYRPIKSSVMVAYKPTKSRIVKAAKKISEYQETFTCIALIYTNGTWTVGAADEYKEFYQAPEYWCQWFNPNKAKKGTAAWKRIQLHRSLALLLYAEARKDVL